MPGLNNPDYKPPEAPPKIKPPTKRFNPYFVDLTMPSLKPGEYMGEGGSIISASSTQEAARQQAELEKKQAEQQKSKETAEKTRSEAVASWLEQLRAEQTAKDLHLEEKRTKLTRGKEEYQPSPFKPKYNMVIVPERAKTMFKGDTASARVPSVQGASPNLYYDTYAREPPAPLPLIAPASANTNLPLATQGIFAAKETAIQAKSTAGYIGTSLSTSEGRARFARTSKQELKADIAYARENPIETIVGAGVIAGAAIIAPAATTALIGGSIAKTALTNPEKAVAGGIEAVVGGAALKGAGKGLKLLLPKSAPTSVFKSKTDVLDIKGGLYAGKTTGTTRQGGEIIKTDLKNVITRLPDIGVESKFEVKSTGTVEVSKLPLLGRISAHPDVKPLLDVKLKSIDPDVAGRVDLKLAEWAKPQFVSKEQVGVRAGALVSEKNALGVRAIDVTGKLKAGTTVTPFSASALSKKIGQETYRRPSVKVEKYSVLTGGKALTTPKTIIASNKNVRTVGGPGAATGSGIAIVKTPMPPQAPWADLKPKYLPFVRTKKPSSDVVGYLADTYAKKPSILPEKPPVKIEAITPQIEVIQPSKAGTATVSKLENVALYDKPIEGEAISGAVSRAIGEASLGQTQETIGLIKPLGLGGISMPKLEIGASSGLAGPTGFIGLGMKQTVSQQEREQQAQKLRQREGLVGQRQFIVDVPSVRELPKVSPVGVSGLIIGQRQGLYPRIVQRQIIRQVEEQKQEQKQVQRQELKLRTPPPYPPQLPPPRPPFTPSIFVTGGNVSTKKFRYAGLSKRGKPSGKITPLADYLSINIAEAKTGRKAYHQAPTAQVKAKFLAEIRARPFSWRFPVAKTRKRKGGMKLL